MAASADATWTCLAPTDESLQGADFTVRARTQDRPDELWVSVRAPNGSWRYLIIGGDGEVLASEGASDKREAFRRALEARIEVRAG